MPAPIKLKVARLGVHFASRHPTKMMFFFTEEGLLKAWKKIYRDKSLKKRRTSRGIDNVTIEDFHKHYRENIKEIYRQIEGDFFEFSPLFEFSQKRKGKKPRTIQAPTVADRVVQKVLSDYLGKKFADRFKKLGIIGSVEGSTIRKTVRQAFGFYKEGYVWVLKTDIKNYFPSINKERILSIVGTLIDERTVLDYINKYLKVSKQPGIPQGTPLSPFIANLFLFDFDEVLSERTEIRHLRYIDDLLIFCRSKEDAERYFYFVKSYLDSLNLEIHELPTEGKTMIKKFDSGQMDVVGVVYRDDRFLIKYKKMQSFKTEVVEALRWRKRLFTYRKLKTEEQKAMVLIKDLNHYLVGWGGAYSFCDIGDQFALIDQTIQKNLSILFKHMNLDPDLIKALLGRVAKLALIKRRPIERL